MIETRALYNSGFLAATFLAQVCTMSAVSDDGIDGDGGNCSMNGDCNDRPAPRKRRRAHGGGGKRSPDLESTLVLVFLIASTASCSRQLGSAKPHPHWLEMWSGAESLAGAALCRWKYHPRSDWREVEPAGQEMCLAAQRAVIGDIVGWVNHYVSGPVAMCASNGYRSILQICLRSNVMPRTLSGLIGHIQSRHRMRPPSIILCNTGQHKLLCKVFRYREYSFTQACVFQFWSSLMWQYTRSPCPEIEPPCNDVVFSDLPLSLFFGR